MLTTESKNLNMVGFSTAAHAHNCDMKGGGKAPTVNSKPLAKGWACSWSPQCEPENTHTHSQKVRR